MNTSDYHKLSEQIAEAMNSLSEATNYITFKTMFNDGCILQPQEEKAYDDLIEAWYKMKYAREFFKSEIFKQTNN